MLGYDLTEKNGRSQKSIFFLLKTIFFKIHSQHKLSTKSVDSLSYKNSEN